MQDNWLKLDPPIRLYPNSQFGIGVLSYFMLADEIRVETCRLTQKGFPGESLLVLIPGSSGLFQIREGTRNDSGTNVRLYLNRTHYGDESISCVWVLKQLLLVAEFPTQAWEFDEQDRATQNNSWEPGQLQYPRLSPKECQNAGHPDLWWVAKDEDHSFISSPTSSSWGLVLVDGLRTKNKYPIVVNLRQEHYPKLTIDRKNIVDWEDDWVYEALAGQSALNSLKNLSALDFNLLWELEEKSVQLAEEIVNFLVREKALLRLRGFEFFRFPIPIAIIGCSKIDRPLKPSIFFPDRQQYDIPKCLYYRRKLWTNLRSSQRVDTPSLNWHSSLWPLLKPMDAILLSQSLKGQGDWLEGTVPLGHLLETSLRLNYPVSGIVQRLQQFVFFGLELPVLDKQAFSSSLIGSEYDLILLSQDLNGHGPWLEGAMPLKHLLEASVRFNSPVSQIVQYLQRFVSFGLELPALDEQLLSSLSLTEDNIILLSKRLNGRSPWLEGAVPLGHLLQVSLQLNRPVSQIVQYLQRFVPFGLELPALDEQLLSSLTVTEDDVILFSRNLNKCIPWLEGVVSLEHLLKASVKLNRPVSEIVQQLQKFVPFGLELPALDEQLLSSLSVTEDDLIWLSWMGGLQSLYLRQATDGYSLWLEETVPQLNLLSISVEYNRPINEIVQQLQKFVPFGLELPALDEQLLSSLSVTQEDLILLSEHRTGIRPWLEGAMPLKHLLEASEQLNRPINEIVQQLQKFVPFGLELPTLDEQLLSSLSLTQEDLILLSKGLDGYSPWLEGAVPPSHLPSASVKLNCPLREIVQRLQQFIPFGLELPTLDEQLLSSLSLTQEDLILLSKGLDGYSPWLEGAVPLSHLLNASEDLNRPVSEIVQRLQRFIPFGLKLPALDNKELSSFRISEDDRFRLSKNLDGYSPWLDGTVPLEHLLEASMKFNRPMSEIVQQLQQFAPFGLELPALNWQAFFELEATADDFLMLSKYLNGDTPLLEGDVSRLHIARAADLRNEPVTVTFERFKQFAPILGLNLPEDDPQTWDLDSLFQPYTSPPS